MSFSRNGQLATNAQMQGVAERSYSRLPMTESAILVSSTTHTLSRYRRTTVDRLYKPYRSDISAYFPLLLPSNYQHASCLLKPTFR